jgi:hypothetical protein
MTAKRQDLALVEVFSPKPTVLRCRFPFGVKLHDCVQNVIHLQVEDDQIMLGRCPSQVLIDIIEGLRVPHRETKLITFGKVERELLELHVRSADLLDRALAPVIVAINSNAEFRVSSYKNYHARPMAAFA